MSGRAHAPGGAMMGRLLSPIVGFPATVGNYRKGARADEKPDCLPWIR